MADTSLITKSQLRQTAELTLQAIEDAIYTHPSHTARASGLYKITVDDKGHVTDVVAVTKDDITALGIPGEDTDTTYSAATTSADGLMSAADKIKLNGIDEGANNYTHPSYTTQTSGLYKITVDATGHVSAVTAVTKADITNLGIPGTDTTYGAAGTGLGLVKSGGDATISDGVITVNDDSHAHVISNVDGLQSALDGKETSGAAAIALADAKGYTDGKIADLINSAPTTLDTLGEIATAMAENADVVAALEEAIGNKAEAEHTHNYAGSSTAGGAANSANKLNTDAGSATQPVYFSNGVPVKTTHTLEASVPSDAKFTDTVYTHPSHTAKASGLYKVTVDDEGHISAATAVTKDDITALGIPAQDTDTVYTHPNYTALTGVPIANQTPDFGETFSVSQPVTDATGHVTAINNRTVTIPSTAASTSAAGLMSASDKSKLDGLTPVATDTEITEMLTEVFG